MNNLPAVYKNCDNIKHLSFYIIQMTSEWIFARFCGIVCLLRDDIDTFFQVNIFILCSSNIKKELPDVFTYTFAKRNSNLNRS